MSLDDFLRLAQSFSDLGTAVQEQLRAVADGESMDDQNPNALRMCEPLLRRLDDLDVDGAADLLGEILEHLAGA